MQMILAIAAGGGLGAVARHYAVAAVSAPWGTVMVNVLGSFAIGALMEIMALKWQVPLEARAFMVTGFLGGFTTFSAFSLDVLKLAETGQYVAAIVYVVLSVILSLVAVFSAMYLMRGVFA